MSDEVFCNTRMVVASVSEAAVQPYLPFQLEVVTLKHLQNTNPKIKSITYTGKNGTFRIGDIVDVQLTRISKETD